MYVYTYVHTEIHSIYSGDLSCVLDGRPRTISEELARTPMPIGGKGSGEEAQQNGCAVELCRNVCDIPCISYVYIYIFMYYNIYIIPYMPHILDIMLVERLCSAVS